MSAAIGMVAAVLTVAVPATARGIRKDQVHFKPGARRATIQGTFWGDQLVDQVRRDGAAQTLAAALMKPSPQEFVNVLPPGSTEVAMFVGDGGPAPRGNATRQRLQLLSRPGAIDWTTRLASKWTTTHSELPFRRQ